MFVWCVCVRAVEDRWREGVHQYRLREQSMNSILKGQSNLDNDKLGKNIMKRRSKKNVKFMRMREVLKQNPI